MIRRLTVAVYLLCCFPLTGQDQCSDADEPDAPTAHITVRASPLGNVAMRIASFDLPKDQTAALLSAVPEVLGCKWTGSERTEYSIEGICRGWLKPVSGSSAGNLHLAGLVQVLHSRGARIVTVYLDVRSSKKIAPPPEWKGGSTRLAREGRFSFTSARPEDLPPDVSIPLEAPPNLIIPILGVLLVPTALAYWIRLRATSAPPEHKVNWVVWMNWINLGTWLYWIGATNVTYLGESLVRDGSSSYIVALILGVLLYSLPPLISQAACLPCPRYSAPRRRVSNCFSVGSLWEKRACWFRSAFSWLAVV